MNPTGCKLDWKVEAENEQALSTKILYTTERNGNFNVHWIKSANRRAFEREKELYEKPLLFGVLELLYIIHSLLW